MYADKYSDNSLNEAEQTGGHAVLLTNLYFSEETDDVPLWCNHTFFLLFFSRTSASIPIGRPEETAGSRHRTHDPASQQLVSPVLCTLLCRVPAIRRLADEWISSEEM